MSKKTAPPAKKPATGKAANSKGKQAPTGKSEISIPVLLDVTYSLSRMVVVIVGVLVALLAVLAGARPLQAGLRAGAAMLVIGLVLWGFSFLVSTGLLEAFIAEQREKLDDLQQAAAGETTMDRQA